MRAAEVTAQQAQADTTHRSQTRPHRREFWEVDALRGLAVVMMVVYHLMYDLDFFGVSDAIFTHPFWFYFQRTTASTFLLLVGVSLRLRYRKDLARHGRVAYAPFVRRGTTIFGWGLVITAVTWGALGAQWAIRFGILHFIGLATLTAYPFLRWRWPNLLLGLLFLAAGKLLQTKTFDLPWLVWLGFEPAGHTYVDYFPFIKWFGVVLLGIFAASILYGDTGRRFPFPNLTAWPPVQGLQWLGRRALPIYLLHQPLLLALLFGVLALAARQP